jgi:histidine triad (HIT) family protein
MSDACIFCRIIRGEAPARILHQDELVTAFQDNAPRAPIHILVVPNAHLESINELKEADALLIGRMVLTARRLAGEQGIADSGYRLVVNTGPDGGQAVSHLHLHLLGGRHLPPFVPIP